MNNESAILVEDTNPTDTKTNRYVEGLIVLVIFFAMIVNPIDWNTSAEFDRATASVGVLTLAKLGIGALAAMIGALGLCFSSRVKRLLMSIPGALLLSFGCMFLIAGACASPQTATISRASALLYLSYLAFTVTSLSILGCRKMLATIVIGSAVYLVLTWALFILVPEQGRFMEYTSATESVIRMGGTGHPNNIAKIASTIALVALAMLIGKKGEGSAVGVRNEMGRFILISVIVLSAATMVATFSRTAILAGVFAGGVMIIDRIWGRKGVLLGIAGCAAGLALLIATTLLTSDGPFQENAVGAVTKSGDIEELTSLTGRTTIWREAVGWIAARPLTGWGMDSAASVMSREATGTHNFLLHMGFSGGVITMILAGLTLIWSVCFGLTSSHEWIRATVCYVLVSGLVEDTVIESFMASLTMMWIIALLAPAIASISDPETSSSNASSAVV
ncbi:MAG: O-antigen ligase family protein [Planctomycetota bacterium]